MSFCKVVLGKLKVKVYTTEINILDISHSPSPSPSCSLDKPGDMSWLELAEFYRQTKTSEHNELELRGLVTQVLVNAR